MDVALLVDKTYILHSKKKTAIQDLATS
jgi:hypothetical protein